MIDKISNIAKIQSGIYARPENEGEIYYVQARHFDNNHQFRTTVKPDLKADDKFEKHYLQPGDVLVAAKGNDHFSVEYKGIIKPAVASTMFIILRPVNAKILPSFLAWFINQKQTQNILADSAQGTSLASITQFDLGNLDIPIPSLEKQELILLIHQLHLEEIRLRKQINSLHSKQVEQQIVNVLK